MYKSKSLSQDVECTVASELVPFDNDDENKKFEKLKKTFFSQHEFKKEIALGKRIGFYRYLNELGTGNFSKVKLGIHSLLHEKVAIKIMDKAKFNSKTLRLLSREITIMDQLPSHPHVIQLFEVYDTPSKLHFMMEFAQGGELYHLIASRGRMDEQSAKIIFRQINTAVTHLHSNLVIHRDLKAENVFFAGPLWIKLGDFGFSTTVSSLCQSLDTFCGSPPYAAPELYVHDSYFGPSIDMWAMGVLLYFMTTGILPFRAENVTKLKQLILACKYSLPSYLSGPLKRLIESLLTLSIPQRANTELVEACDWFEDTQDSSSSQKAASQRKHFLSHDQICDLLLKWFSIQPQEIEDALLEGPVNNLAGVYRLLKVSGVKYLENAVPIPQKLEIKNSSQDDHSPRTNILKSETYLNSKPEAKVIGSSVSDMGRSKNKTKHNSPSATCNIL
ncbi:G2-specific protein kinase nim-1 [Cichlidogyrus casuarinus]|uniref:non-specific serine/threonine protein kinase n=1 Tax=Cichlidogyrus casuarinus TaxID=1844966 RepID=A0ABD2Q8L1_9PLAT